jgi:hypothetical protein
MARCDHGGNDYDKSFHCYYAAAPRTPSTASECAIHMLALDLQPLRLPNHRSRRGSRRGRYFLLRNCAKRSGVTGLRDRQEGERGKTAVVDIAPSGLFAGFGLVDRARPRPVA